MPVKGKDGRYLKGVPVSEKDPKEDKLPQLWVKPDANGKLPAWVKVVSPGGAEITVGRDSNVRTLAKMFTVEALQALVDMMSDTKQKGAVRVAAATAIWDRGWGKPVTPIVDATKMSDDDLLRETQKLMQEKGMLPTVVDSEDTLGVKPSG
jgi:hypothetical protein